MKRILSLIRAAASLALLTAIPTWAQSPTGNLIQNGSFETGDFSGWTVTPNPSGNYAKIYAGRASDGIYSVDFNYDGCVATAVLQQSFATVPGDSYSFSFDLGVTALGRRVGSLDYKIISQRGDLVAGVASLASSSGEPAVFTTVSGSFAADGPSATIWFRDTTPDSDYCDPSLDNIRVFKLGPLITPPTITTNPVTQVVGVGGPATFSVTASGSQPNYQWYLNGNPINDATGSCFTIPNTTAALLGSYQVRVANSAGTNWSAIADLWLDTLKMYAGLGGVNVYGPAGSNCVVQYTTNLTAPVIWTPLQTVTVVTNPTVVIDYDSPKQPKRFYRTVPQQ